MRARSSARTDGRCYRFRDCALGYSESSASFHFPVPRDAPAACPGNSQRSIVQSRATYEREQTNPKRLNLARETVIAVRSFVV